MWNLYDAFLDAAIPWMVLIALNGEDNPDLRWAQTPRGLQAGRDRMASEIFSRQT